MNLFPGISQIQSALLGVAFGALVTAVGTAALTHKLDAAKYERLVAAQATANARAVNKALVQQRTIDARNASAAAAESFAQGKLQAETVTITQRIPVYVHETSCPGGLTVGLARVLRGAADGTDPGSLALAGGQSDDTCSDVTPAEVAGWFTAYAGAARQNSEQLDALIAAVKANDATSTKP